MKKPILICISVLLIVNTEAVSRSAEQWSSIYAAKDYDRIDCVLQTRDSGYIVAGVTMPLKAGSVKVWIMKIDRKGLVSWQKTYLYSGSHSDMFSVKQTADKGYVATALSTAFGTGKTDVWILKLRANGDEEWMKTFGGNGCDQIHSIQQTADEGFILAGWTNKLFGAVNYDLWVLKLNKKGIMVWQKTYGGGSSEQAHSIQQTSDNGYIVAGWTYSFGLGNRDIWVLKLRANGDVTWQKTYSGFGNDNYYFIRQISTGAYTVLSYKMSRGNHDIWILHLKQNGDIDRQKTYSGNYNAQTAHAHSIQQTSDGGYIIAGEAYSNGSNDRNIWILKLKQDGDVDWEKIYGGNRESYAELIQQTSDGGYIVVGWTRSFGDEKDILAGWTRSLGDEKDIWVLKLDYNGELLPAE